MAVKRRKHTPREDKVLPRSRFWNSGTSVVDVHKAPALVHPAEARGSRSLGGVHPR